MNMDNPNFSKPRTDLLLLILNKQKGFWKIQSVK